MNRRAHNQNKQKQKEPKSMIKRIALCVAAVAMLTLTTSLLAGETQPFNQELFAKAKMDGKTVLVDFHATWCPVCKKQAEAIPQVLKEEQFKEVVALTADYDMEKELKKQLKVGGQSTLVVFKGEKEVAREQGITSAAAIGKLLAKGL
jgi:thiol-disulfide isomerase/thioredoxin